MANAVNLLPAQVSEGSRVLSLQRVARVGKQTSATFSCRPMTAGVSRVRYGCLQVRSKCISCHCHWAVNGLGEGVDRLWGRGL